MFKSNKTFFLLVATIVFLTEIVLKLIERPS